MCLSVCMYVCVHGFIRARVSVRACLSVLLEGIFISTKWCDRVVRRPAISVMSLKSVTVLYLIIPDLECRLATVLFLCVTMITINKVRDLSLYWLNLLIFLIFFFLFHWWQLEMDYVNKIPWISELCKDQIGMALGENKLKCDCPNPCQ